MSKKPKLIILDRDGVINKDSDKYIKSVDEFLPYESSLRAITALSDANIKIAITTNQSGISRGFYTVDTLNLMHKKLSHLLSQIGQAKIDHLIYCPHGPSDNCLCRKPKPGMLLACLDYFKLKPDECVFVGDTTGDLLAAEQSKIPSILVRTGKGRRTIKAINDKPQFAHLCDVPVFNNLLSYTHSLTLNT